MNIVAAGDLAHYAKTIDAQMPKCHRLVMAGTDIPESKCQDNGSVFRISEKDGLFTGLFHTFDFDAAVFFLHRGERQEGYSPGSLENLEALLTLCALNDVGRFILVSSTEVCGAPWADESSPAEPRNHAGILLDAGERMCALYGSQPGRDALVLRVPYLYGATGEPLLLEKLLAQALRRGKVTLPGRADQLVDLIHVDDAVSLLIRMIEDAPDHNARTVHAGGKAVSFADLARWIQKRYPGCEIAFSVDPDAAVAPVKCAAARRHYDWVAMHDLEQDIRGAAAETHKHAAPRRGGAVRQALLRHGWVLQLAELALGFALMQYLLTATAESLQFRFIDFRLLFVVLIGSLHGTRAGVLAALLSCVSNVIGYVSLNLDWRAIVYDVDNWLPYVSYLLAGVVTGYARDKKTSAVAFIKRKMDVLEQRYAFLLDLYHKTLRIKGQYRDRLISYKKSYGKVYEVANRLDCLVPDMVFQEAVHVLEEEFGGSGIAIYTLNAAKSYARLEVCSARLYGTLKQSIAVTQYLDLNDRQSGHIWVNRGMLEDHPFYCMPLLYGGVMIAAVMAFDVPYALQSASAANQFAVLCKLIQSALGRAVSYHSASEALACIAGTRIMQRDRFRELLDIRREMKRRSLSGYALLRVNDPGSDLSILSKKVERGIRRTDRIGQGEDGNIYIMLVQARMDSSSVVTDRLAYLGVRCTPVELVNMGAGMQKGTSDVA